jgi:hypothetical protein
MFCNLGLIFGGTEGIGFRFHVLHSQTRFRRYRGCRVPFSCFALLDPFRAEPRAPSLIFKFSAPVHFFGGTEGIESRFYVLRSLTGFRQYRGRRVPFSCFALPNLFSAIPMASVPFFMFCASGPVLGGTDGVRSYFHVLRS